MPAITEKTVSPLEKQRNVLCNAGIIMLAVITIIPALGFFSPLSKGPIIAGLFALPLILFIAFAIWLRRLERYRPSHFGALMLGLVLLTAFGFMSLPFSYLIIGAPLLWQIVAIQVVLLISGAYFGYLRHDPELLKKRQEERYTIAPGGRIVFNPTVTGVGFRDTTGSKVLDSILKVVTAFYSVFVLIGLVLGGGAPYVIIRVLQPYVPADNPLGVHVIGMLVLGMLALPGLGFLLPGFFRIWSGLLRIERAASVGHPRLVIESAE